MLCVFVAQEVLKIKKLFFAAPSYLTAPPPSAQSRGTSYLLFRFLLLLRRSLRVQAGLFSGANKAESVQRSAEVGAPGCVNAAVKLTQQEQKSRSLYRSVDFNLHLVFKRIDIVHAFVQDDFNF